MQKVEFNSITTYHCGTNTLYASIYNIMFLYVGLKEYMFMVISKKISLMKVQANGKSYCFQEKKILP